jgi:hypothetical protein
VRLGASVVDGVADDRAGHAVPAATAELGTDDLDHLDTCLAQQGVGGGVPVMGVNTTPGSTATALLPLSRCRRSEA